MRAQETLPYDQWIECSPEEMAARAAEFYQDVNRRRTTRYFSERQVPRGVIETCLLAAGTAPSGAFRGHRKSCTRSDRRGRARLLSAEGTAGVARCAGASRHR
ncbi:nitroreductase family protein [Ensifer canadensis]